MNPSPILQAFISGHQGGLKLREQEQQKKQKDTQLAIEEQKRRDEQVWREKQQSMQEQQLSATLAELGAKLKREHLNRRMDIANAYQKGVLKPTEYSNPQDQLVADVLPDFAKASFNTPDVINDQGEKFKVNQFGSGTEVAQIAGEQALAAKKPLADYVFGQSKEMQGIKAEDAQALETARQKNRVAIEGEKQKNAISLQELRNTSAEKVAGIRASATKVAASIRASGKDKVDAENLSKEAENAAFGFGDYTGKTKTDNNVRAVLNTKGWKAVPPKKIEALKNISQFQGVLEDMNEFIKNHGTDSTLGTLGNMAAANVPFIPTDIKADTERLKGRAAKVATFMGEIGRKTEGDIERALAVMTKSGQTKAQMEKARDTLVRDFSQGLKTILSGLPKEQQSAILDKYQVPEDIQHTVLGTEKKSGGASIRKADKTKGEEELPNGEIVKIDSNGSGTVVGRWRD